MRWSKSYLGRERLFVLACAAVIVIHAIIIAHRRMTHLGDFDISREFGQRFLAGEYLYEGGLHYPYTPTAAMYFSPLALVDPSLAFGLRYVTALLCIWLIFRWLNRMTQGGEGPSTGALMLTLLLMSHYIIRDLDDGGPHVILLAMLVGGLYCVRQRRVTLAAMWLGLAAALKMTAALFLPFFLWKRQWRLAIATAIAAACWIVLPAVWMGPLNWWNHQREWMLVAALGSYASARPPIVIINEERVQNQSLKHAIKQYLAKIGNLEARGVNTMTMGILLSLVAFCYWRWRRPYQGPQDPAWLPESSAVLVLALLLSPVIWVQHLVWMLPAVYLIMLEARSPRGLGKPATVAMGVYVVLALVLNRELLGKANYLNLLDYHIHTVAMLLVLAVLLFRRPMTAQQTNSPPTLGAAEKIGVGQPVI